MVGLLTRQRRQFPDLNRWYAIVQNSCMISDDFCRQTYCELDGFLEFIIRIYKKILCQKPVMNVLYAACGWVLDICERIRSCEIHSALLKKDILPFVL